MRSLALIINILPRLESDLERYVDFVQSIAKGREKELFHDCYWDQYAGKKYPNLILFNQGACLNKQVESGQYQCFVLTEDGEALYKQAYDYLYKNVVACFPGSEKELTGTGR